MYSATLLWLSTSELIIVALLILILFGGKKIPELMRGLGRGVKEFKDGMNGVIDDEEKTKDNKQQTTTTEEKTK